MGVKKFGKELLKISEKTVAGFCQEGIKKGCLCRQPLLIFNLKIPILQTIAELLPAEGQQPVIYVFFERHSVFDEPGWP